MCGLRTDGDVLLFLKPAGLSWFAHAFGRGYGRPAFHIRNAPLLKHQPLRSRPRAGKHGRVQGMPVLDAGLLAAAQAVAHYEITVTLKTWANELVRNTSRSSHTLEFFRRRSGFT